MVGKTYEFHINLCSLQGDEHVCVGVDTAMLC